MIISRTPFRVSFFGGGTDYPQWYREHGGAVLATTIDKYCYISVRTLPPFFEHRYRVVYSVVENVKDIAEIRHPAVRAVLGWMQAHTGLEIHHDGDLPARSGLGSSSAFTVGLLNAMHALKGRRIADEALADEALYVEQRLIEEPVGSQDQISAAFGGFNNITFLADGRYQVEPMILPRPRLDALQDHLMLFFTGISRQASEVAAVTIANLRARTAVLHRMREMVDEAMLILSSPSTDLVEFGRLLHESWILKRSLADRVSSPFIDGLYEAAREAGADGGKLLGAGGGGFLLLFARPDDHAALREKLDRLIHVPFRFESAGSQIIFYDPETEYPAEEQARANGAPRVFRDRGGLGSQ
jgi:D-glycero-alpha-D-manno-heptose-7-phosphate kinase